MKPYLREREKESKVSTVTGIVLTVAVHVLACLLFVFSGLKYIYPPPQEQTFVIAACQAADFWKTASG